MALVSHSNCSFIQLAPKLRTICCRSVSRSSGHHSYYVARSRAFDNCFYICHRTNTSMKTRNPQNDVPLMSAPTSWNGQRRQLEADRRLIYTIIPSTTFKSSSCTIFSSLIFFSSINKDISKSWQEHQYHFFLQKRKYH